MGVGELKKKWGRGEPRRGGGLRKNRRADIGVMPLDAEDLRFSSLEGGVRGALSSSSAHLHPAVEEVSPSPGLFLLAANHRSSLIHHVRQQPSTFSSGLVYLRTYQASNICLAEMLFSFVNCMVSVGDFGLDSPVAISRCRGVPFS